MMSYDWLDKGDIRYVMTRDWLGKGDIRYVMTRDWFVVIDASGTRETHRETRETP
jgi:hypothetical protein